MRGGQAVRLRRLLELVASALLSEIVVDGLMSLQN
jgi:hypothetical protein